MIGAAFARAATGTQAFLAGQRVGRDWAEGRSLRDEARHAFEREPRVALAAAGVALAAGAFAAWKRKEMLVLGAAGFLIGSGIWERARSRAAKGSPATPTPSAAA